MAPARAVRPRLRRDAQLRAHAEPGGGGEVVLPGGEAVALSAVELAVVRAMDGERSARELLAALQSPLAASPSQLRTLLGRLDAAGLLAGEDGPGGEAGGAEGQPPAEAKSVAGAPTAPQEGPAGPARLTAEMTAPTRDATANDAPANDDAQTATGARPVPLYDPALFSTNLTAVGVAVDQSELGRLVADALATLRRGEVQVAQDMLRNGASLAPGDGKVRGVLEALAPLGNGATEREVAAAWAACAALAPTWTAAAEAQLAQDQAPGGAPAAAAEVPKARSSGGSAFAPAAPAASTPAEGLLAPPSRVPFRAIGAIVLFASAAAGAGMWWAASQPELPVVRLRRLEPVRHATYEGGTASAVRQHRAAWVEVPRTGEVTYLAALRGQLTPADDVVRVTPSAPEPAGAPAAVADPTASARLQRRVVVLERRVRELERRASSGRGGRPAAARGRALAAARAQLEAARTAWARAQPGPPAASSGREAVEVAVKAPFAGTLAELRVGVGQRVRRGGQAALVVDRSVVHLRFAVPAGTPHAVGDRLTVAVDVAAPPEREGRIVEVRALGSRVQLDVELPDPQASLPLVLSAPSFRLVREVATGCFVAKDAVSCAARNCTLWQWVDGRAQPRRVRMLEAVSDGVWVAWEPAPGGREAPLIVGTPQLPLSKLRAGLKVAPR